jgi:hypothetical protein
MQVFFQNQGFAVLWPYAPVDEVPISQRDIMSQIESLQIHTISLYLTVIEEWNLMLDFLIRKHFQQIIIYFTDESHGVTPWKDALIMLNSNKVTFKNCCHKEYPLIMRLCCQRNWFDRVIVFYQEPILTRELSIMQLNTRAMLGFIKVNWVGKRRLPKELLMMLRAFFI